MEISILTSFFGLMGMSFMVVPFVQTQFEGN